MINFPKFAIDKRRFTIIFFALFIVFGITSFLSMPRSEDPQFEFPATMVLISYPGTNSIDMETLIVKPIEDELNVLDDIKVLKSDVSDGLAVVRVEFLYGSDSKSKYDDVVSSVTKAKQKLPKDIPYIDIVRLSPIDVNIIQIALMSDTKSYGELKELGDNLEKKIEKIKGIKSSETIAYPEQQVHILVDLNLIRAMGISLNDLISAVKSSGANIPGGYALFGQNRFTIQTHGGFQNIDEIKNTIVNRTDNTVVYMKDIADVRNMDSLPVYEARYQGKKAIFVTAIQRKGSNIFNIMDDINSVINTFKQELSEDVDIEIPYNQSDSVHERLNAFYVNLIQGLVVVGLMTVLFLGLRSAFVILVIIPISIIMSLGWVNLSGFGIQQMTISGLVIALGLLVDNAIVVTENVNRFLHRGYKPIEAAIEGTQQVSWPIISGTLTTALAFIPILLLPTGAGAFLRSMPITVIYTLFASLLIALSLSPMFISFVFKSHAIEPTWFARLIQKIVDGPYSFLLKKTLSHPVKFLVGSLVLFLVSLYIATFLGVSMFPKAEKPMLFINIELPEESDFNETNEFTKKVEVILREYDLVKSVATNVGKTNPRIYYNMFPKHQKANFAQLVVNLKTGDLDIVSDFVKKIRQQFSQFSGIKINIKELLQGPPYEAPVEFRVIGEDLKQLRQFSLKVEKILKSTKGTLNVENPISRSKIDVKVHINKDKAAMYGLPLHIIDQSVRTSLVGIRVGDYRNSSGNNIPILIKGKTQDRHPNIEIFDKISLKSMVTNQMIPINQLATLELVESYPEFQHYKTERMVRVISDVETGYQTEELTNRVYEEIKKHNIPKGISVEVAGEQEQRKESFSGMIQMFLLAILGIFAVLVLQFNSFTQPLVIFVVVPFALTGMILGLLICGYTFSFTAFIGLTSLIGVVINNSIMLVDYVNTLMKAENISPMDAIIGAGKTRFLPILLTTLTTVGGLLPLTLSKSPLWSPMGVTIISGLLFSTLLSLFVVPALLISCRKYIFSIRK